MKHFPYCHMLDGNDCPDLSSGPWKRSEGFQRWMVFDVPSSVWVSTDPSIALRGGQAALQWWRTSEANFTQQMLLLRPMPSPACIKSAGRRLRFEKYRENQVLF